MQPDERGKDFIKADKSCLTETERQFLECAPDFDEIVATSNSYCKKIEFFLEILQKKRKLDDMKINEKEALINKTIDHVINMTIHKIQDS